MLRKLLVISLIGALSCCNLYREIDFRTAKEENYTKECGYTFFSAYYEHEDRIVINICTPDSCDYYQQFNPLDCYRNIEIESVEASFVNTQQDLVLDSVEKGTLHRFKLPDLKSAVENNEVLSVKIRFKDLTNSQLIERTYLMKKNKNIYFVRKGVHG